MSVISSRSRLLLVGSLLIAPVVHAAEEWRGREVHDEISALALASRESTAAMQSIRVDLGRHRQQLIGLEPELRLELERKVLAVELLVDEYERRPMARSQRPSEWAGVDRDVVPSGQHSECFEARPGLGSATTTLLPAGELWLRASADSWSQWTTVTTAGSNFDTTIEVWSDCPGRDGQRLVVADDEVGLQAQTTVEFPQSGQRFLRIAGWRGASGRLVVTIAGTAGTISGRVVHEDTQAPQTQRFVRVWRASGDFAGAAQVDAAGAYLVGGLVSGSYYVSTLTYPTWSLGLLDELYNDLPCPGGVPSGCDPTLGAPVVVTAGEATTGIDLALGVGGRLAGRTQESGTNLPIANLLVSAYNPAGGLVATATTDGAGRYLIGGLAGDIHLVVEGGAGHQSEIYDDIPCSNGCYPPVGTPISTVNGVTIAGVDFSLLRRGAIAGRVTHAATAAAIPNAVVRVSGPSNRSVTTDSEGNYHVGGLPPGNYYVSTQTYGSFVDEAWDDLPCSVSCLPLAGDPVAVAVDATTEGIDFALDKRGGIEGVVTDAQSGLPVASAGVSIFDAAGNYQGNGQVHNGSYSLTAVRPGTYKVIAAGPNHQGVLYDGIDCPSVPPSCSLDLGTDVVVAPETVTSGIDFSLPPLGSLSGTVVAAAGQTMSYYYVAAWNLAGQLVKAGYSTAPAWTLNGIAPGDYYVAATHPAFVGEVFDDVACPGGTPSVCDPDGLATVVQAELGTTTMGIDFELEKLGSLSGILTRASDGLPAYGTVEVFDQFGALVSSQNVQGAYEVVGLPTGTYHVKGSSFELSSRLYDDVPCPLQCDVTDGTAVAVVMGSITSGVDIALPPMGAIEGYIGATAGPLPTGLLLTAFSTDSSWYRYWWVDGGPFSIPVADGNYYVRVLPEEPHHLGQIYDGVDCPFSSCPLDLATLVVVQAGATTSGIDFALEPLTGIVGQVVDSQGQPLAGVAIDLWSSTGVWVASATTGPNGRYRVTPNGGSYYVSTDNGVGAVDQLWLDVPCPLGPAYLGLCDPLDGEAVVLSAEGLVAGIDFVLERVPIFVDGFESGDTSAWSP